jgi:hypothetical protein
MTTHNIGRESLAEGFNAGHGAVGETESAISPVAFAIQKHVVICAASTNSGAVIVGRPGAAGLGFVLEAGQQSQPIFVDSTDKVAVIGSAADQAYSWIMN